MLQRKWCMRRYFGKQVWAIVIFLSLVSVLGFIVGHGRRHVTSAAKVTDPVVEIADTSRQSDPAPVNVKKTPRPAPADLTILNGKEFVYAMPSLETLARGGNLEAARVLYQRLRSCVGFEDSPDEAIRERENANYQQQLGISRRIRSEHPDRPENPVFSEASMRQTHERALKAAFDQRDLCTALTSQQIERYLDWVRFALERHDRQTILDATTPNDIGLRGTERVRNAERLTEIAEIERNELNNLISAGDLTALERAAYAYGSDSTGLLRRDPELAYMYAYALSLIEDTRNDLRQISAMMESLASGRPLHPPLSAQQIDTARARGLALFQRCCAKGTHD
jgi:hypothetical protein